ncbi:MAG TPA: hypothetical protein VGL53_22195 [Bryobacteraceae bacterium]|jgi:hypothetical protein
MSNLISDKGFPDDRPIWLTTLADADRDASAPEGLESNFQLALRRRRTATWAKRASMAGITFTLAASLWVMPKHLTVPAAIDDVADETLSDLIADAGSLPADDDSMADFVPTTLASEQPLESVRVVRVSVPGGALARYGVPSEVSSAPEVTADLLVGQDGIPRAIRVVDNGTK